jgi:membrane-bound lytic murein transglycosylase A
MISCFKALGLLALVVWSLSGCAVPLKTPGVQRQPEPAGISDDMDRDSLRSAIRQSAVYLAKLPRDRIVGEQPKPVSAGEVLDSLSAFERLLEQWACAACVTREVQERFDFVPSSADEQMSEVLFTGYYQPVIEGSLVRTEEYRYPLYARPADLMTAEQVAMAPTFSTQKMLGRVKGEEFMPYYTRQEIDRLGVLSGRGLEIAWLKDPVDVFFLHIQGSGLIRLPDDRQLTVGYTAQNGHPYRSIGRLLIENGKVPKKEMSMQRLRRYLAENPEERDAILEHNESYVFFRLLENGPLGSLEVPVTPGRTIATDARLFPKGAIAFVQTQIPIIDAAGQLTGWRPTSRFVLNQDTGGAIRGYQRADLYFGTGDEAGALAGFMNSRGKLYFLILKSNAARLKDDGVRMK